MIHCTSASHALANREFLFPFVSVVDVSEAEMAAMPDALGPTLVVTAISDQPLIDRPFASSLIGRLNLGPIPTNQIVWTNRTKAICSNICTGEGRFRWLCKGRRHT